MKIKINWNLSKNVILPGKQQHHLTSEQIALILGRQNEASGHFSKQTLISFLYKSNYLIPGRLRDHYSRSVHLGWGCLEDLN